MFWEKLCKARAVFVFILNLESQKDITRFPSILLPIDVVIQGREWSSAKGVVSPPGAPGCIFGGKKSCRIAWAYVPTRAGVERSRALGIAQA